MQSINSNKDILSSSLVEQLPGFIYIKNIESVYTSATQQTARLYGFKNSAHISGYNDFELKCQAIELAATFQEEDKKIIATDQNMSLLRINKYADNKIHIFLMKKTPIKNLHGTIIGVSGIADEISDPAIGQAIFKIIDLGNPNYNKKSNRKNFEIDANELFNRLSPREAELVFYYIRGFSSKEIGLFMQLSSRTVESYIETVQNKFYCNSRNEFLIYCLANGFSNVIPQIILQRCLKKIIKL